MIAVHPVSLDRRRQVKGMRVASFFAGAGGFDLGLIAAGHDVVWANDFDADAVATYRMNIGDEIILSDIADVSVEDVPSVNLMTAGLPCQGFSAANIHKIDNDSRNDLHAHFWRFVNHGQPDAFIIENVRGMTSLGGGSHFSEILEVFGAAGKAGYEIDYRILHAADFGIPQSRVRLFIVGVRKDRLNTFGYEFPQTTHSKKPGSEGIHPWVTIADALDSIPEPDEDHDLLNHVCSQYKVTNRNFTGHRRTDPDKPSPTILARGNGKGGVCAIQHPKNHRRLSVRESALIQTFPADYEFKGKLMSMYRQVGNAVPVDLGKLVAQGFFEKG